MIKIANVILESKKKMQEFQYYNLKKKEEISLVYIVVVYQV